MLYTKRILGTIAYLGGLPANLEAFTWAWGQLIQYSNEYVCNPLQGEILHLDKATVSLHDFARNSLADRFLGDWLWMTDTDHAFDPDILARMLFLSHKYDLSVVTALYRHRAGPGCPVIYQWDSDGVFALPIANWDRDIEVLQVGSAGAGCLLIRRPVFDRIRTELHEQPFDRFAHYGEDHAFFKRCAQLHIPVYALTRIESPHIVVDTLKMRDYRVEDSMVTLRQETEGYR